MKTEAMINIDDYRYDLPEDRIAKYPLTRRDASKLLVYKKGSIAEARFSEIGQHLPSGSRLIYNNTRVIHARLPFRKDTGALIEIFCLTPHDPLEYQLSFSQTHTCVWKCMVGNLKKWKSGRLSLIAEISGKQYTLEAEKVGQDGNTCLVRFSWNNTISFGALLDNLGTIPIPPYLNRSSETLDSTRYQTVYSKPEGSVAAPTAGLHFTGSVLNSLKQKNIGLHEVTLHVGAGTFQPVKSKNALDHAMHSEFFSVSAGLIKLLSEGRQPIISTGTTTLRTLESLYWLGVKSIKTGKIQTCLEQWEYNELNADVPADEVFAGFYNLLTRDDVKEFRADTGIMIVPGYRFRVVDALITNYHQPRSTLLLLVAAFIGKDWRKVYQYSLEKDFRFLSYGDSSLLWGKLQS